MAQFGPCHPTTAHGLLHGESGAGAIPSFPRSLNSPFYASQKGKLSPAKTAGQIFQAYPDLLLHLS